jgi:leader peptidase (prepilin peptidase)/N-methyltransferase
VTFLLGTLAPFLFGACIGSFLNVIVYRVPLGRSIVTPGSHCAACGKALRWFHNIPIFSWLFLNGEAACCGTRIDGRYPVIELVTALLTVALWQSFTPAVAAVYLIFTYALIVGTCIDLDHFIIPDTVSLGGCGFGVLASLALPQLHETTSRLEALQSSGIGLFVGGGGLFAISVIGTLIFRKDAMGLGDVKLMGGIGALLGWEGVVFTIVAASTLGSVIGLAVIVKRSRKSGVPIPFGPFLAGGAVLFMIRGREWFDAYLQHTGFLP